MNVFIGRSLPSQKIAKELLEGVHEHTETSGRKSDVNYYRTLDKDERNGVWALLGILAGSWIVAGILGSKSAYAEPATDTPAAVEAEKR